MNARPVVSSPGVFAGFPAGARATAVPSIFFSELMPRIEDASELRVTLYLIYALGRRRGYPRFISRHEIEAEAPLLASLGDGGDGGAMERLQRGLDLAIERRSIIATELKTDGKREQLYLLNTPSDRRALAEMQAGRLPPGRQLPAQQGAPASQRSNVFQLYEENIGPLTPLVGDELKEAERLYPFEWIEEAMREAALLNKRSWRYVAAILRRWATEGRKRETAGRDPGEGDSARAQLLRRYRELGGQ